MTIRLRCAACHRKLKVPDAALGKKVQCPECGARFLGTIESPPPVAEAAQESAPAEVAAVASGEEVPLIDAVFAEMGTSAPLDVPNLALDEPDNASEVAEVASLEPQVVEDDAMVVEEAIEEEPAQAVADGNAVEVAEEDEAEESPKKQPKKKKKRGLLCGCLVGLGFLTVLGCGGLGIIGYRFANGSIGENDWKYFSKPEARCGVMMPGDPVATEERPPGGVRHVFTVEKPWAQSTFWLSYHDASGGNLEAAVNARADEEIKIQSVNLGASAPAKRPVTLGPLHGQELMYANVHGKRTAILRIFAAKFGNQTRVYELYAEGPNLDVTSGVGIKFFGSFTIVNMPVVPGLDAGGGRPRPGAPPAPPKR